MLLRYTLVLFEARWNITLNLSLTLNLHDDSLTHILNANTLNCWNAPAGRAAWKHMMEKSGLEHNGDNANYDKKNVNGYHEWL